MPFFQNAQNANAHGTFIEVHGDQIHQVMTYNTNNADPLAQLSPVPDAMYNSVRSVSGCMEGTRQEVIKTIVRWMDGDGDQPVCWLYGAAGAGKSAIARTIAEMCVTKNRLAASFFFFRAAGRRSKINHLIPTLAHNLASSVPATRPHIKRVLMKDPHIINRSLDDQFRTLITEPMQSITGFSLSKVVQLVTRRSRPLVIIIDALDECDDKSRMTEFIEIVARGLRDHQLPFRFLFTSRVEEHIQKKFSASLALPVTYSLALHDFNADADIRTFFITRFLNIYEENRRLMGNVSLPWPSGADLVQLVERSAGSFIFAFTLVNFVDDGTDLPHRKLQACLLSHAGLDPLYSQILQTNPRNPRFLQIFETIMTITEQLSIQDLASLFQIEPGDVIHALLGVQSILIIPENDHMPVRPFHTSLRDFLTTKTRSNDLFINPSTRHLLIALDCLTAMISCNGNKFFEHGGLEYASRSWSYHLLCSIQEEGGDNLLFSQDGASMIKTLIVFVSQLFDSWVDSMIYRRLCS